MTNFDSEIKVGLYSSNGDPILQSLADSVAEGEMENVTVVVGLPGYAIEGVLAGPSAMIHLVARSGITLSPELLRLSNSIHERPAMPSGLIRAGVLTLIRPRLRGAMFPLPEVLRIPLQAVCWWSVLESESVSDGQAL